MTVLKQDNAEKLFKSGSDMGQATLGRIDDSAAPGLIGKFFNTGAGMNLQVVDIGHQEYIGLVDPDTAFWSLVKKDELGSALTDGGFIENYRGKRDGFLKEMDMLRFGLSPSAVYFNPTDRCDMNCSYCYIPEDMRKKGENMSASKLMDALDILESYFSETIGAQRKPRIIFHGAEPLLNRDAVFSAIEKRGDAFEFGIQTNGANLDTQALEFLTSRNIGIGLSLDGHNEAVAGKTRATWGGANVFGKVTGALENLRGYPNYNVILTATSANMAYLTNAVEFFHELEVPTIMLNPVRLTRPGARALKPGDSALSTHYLKALDRAWELYEQTGRKMVVANFANILISILAPTARRLMCDISPCGGGRSFFAVSAQGDIYPCSEFIGLPEYNGGNLFKGELGKALDSAPFGKVTQRKVELIDPCRHCAIRHFCGSPCPAEAAEYQGGMDKPGAFCELYEEQARYAFRLIADGKENDYLWDNWDEGTSETRITDSIMRER